MRAWLVGYDESSTEHAKGSAPMPSTRRRGLLRSARFRVAAALALVVTVLGIIAAAPSQASLLHRNRGYAGYLELDYPGARRADLYIPSRLAKHPQLWVVLHGAHQDIKEIETYGWKSVADAKGFLVVYPKGWKEVWSAGTCCFADEANWPDEIAFLNTVVDSVKKRYPQVAPGIHAVGFSNGGMMAYTWGCSNKSVVTIGSVAGAWVDQNGCSRPKLKVHSIHAVPDAIVPYYGGPSAYTRTTFESEEKLRVHFPRGSQVTQHKLMDGGHSWPNWAAQEIWNVLH